MAKKLFFIAIIFLSFLSVRADVVQPGAINRQFMITNIADYKNFNFYFNYVSYRYEYGYHANPPKEVPYQANKRYSASERGDATKLYATDAKGKRYESNITIGGGDNVSDHDINTIVDVYTITSINKGIITLKKTEEIIVYGGGVEKRKKVESAPIVTDNGNNITPWLIGSSVVALAVLLLLFLKKKKRSLLFS